jgi:hypothetical protein
MKCIEQGKPLPEKYRFLLISLVHLVSPVCLVPLVSSDPANKTNQIDQTNQTDEKNRLVSGTIIRAEVDAMSNMTYDPAGQGIAV